MASQWQGDPQKLQQLCQMFEAASSPDTQTQQQVMASLNQFSQLPDFNMYLVTVFAKLPEKNEVVRQFAGLTLKTNVTRSPQGGFSPEMAQYICANCLEALNSSSKAIRHTAGTVLTTIVQKVGLQACEQTLQKLVEGIQSQSNEVVEGSLSALSKICEDAIPFLQVREGQSELFANWSAGVVLPKIFERATPSSAAFVRQLCLELLNHFALGYVLNDDNIPQLKQFASRYIETLGVFAQDTQPEVVGLVCKGFSYAVDNSWSCLTAQHYAVILSFMLKASMHQDYNVRYEALCVWGPCAKDYNTWDYIKPLLPDLVPVLMENMVYTQADYMAMDGAQLQDDNAACPDAPDEIQPRHHNKDSRGAKDEEDEEEENKPGGAWGAEWTARKSAASALDDLTGCFPDEVLSIVLPLIEKRLQDPDWEKQESGVLAFGAIGHGGLESLKKFLPTVVGMLLKLSSAPKPLLRTICCWCMSRFSGWICDASIADHQQRIAEVLRCFLQRCLDRNKRVQEAACSALATFFEAARFKIAPHLDDVCAMVTQAFNMYQTKNLRILYDSVGTLAWADAQHIGQPKYMEALLTPVMQRFNTVPDNDPSTVAMFECLQYMTQSLAPAMAPAIPTIIQRCTRVIQEVSRAAKLWEQNPNEYELPNVELVAVAVDLLSGILEGFGPESKMVLAQHNFLVLLPEILSHRTMRIKQNGYAMMGVAACNCLEQMMPLLPELLPLCAQGLAPNNTPNVGNNAVWAIGEICVRVGDNFMAQYLDALVQACAGLLQAKLDPQRGTPAPGFWQLCQNVCITLGRFGVIAPERTAKHLPSFMAVWCQVMPSARYDEEKVKAFAGMVQLVKVNPSPGLQCTAQLCAAIASMGPQPPPQLQPRLLEIMQSYKQAHGERWPQIYASLADHVKQRLQTMYQFGL
eukprot:TRINITY_DN74302_c0_g1_i1.p1 TRINITY_DN74302_c0_g1~~TRINITY_DN74302_c0_g1_i1.p1  ORF type:complete len:950 (+),score=212.25 TRINITY_DN74302_c0_g1_i1:99-2852(+)